MKRALARLDSVHQSLARTAGTIEPGLFAIQPSESEWSVAQVVHHLVLSEERVVQDLERALQGPPAKIRLLKKLIPMRIISLRIVKVKAPRSVVPTESLSWKELIARYDQIRARLKQLCAEHGPERLKQVCVKHPFLGDLDGLSTVSRVAFHEQRHLKQIRDILKKLDRQKV